MDKDREYYDKQLKLHRDIENLHQTIEHAQRAGFQGVVHQVTRELDDLMAQNRKSKNDAL